MLGRKLYRDFTHGVFAEAHEEKGINLVVMGPGVISIIHDVNGKIDGPSCINRLPKGFLKEARKAKTLKDEFARVQFAGDQVKLLTGAERTEQIWSGDEAKAIDERS